MYRGPNNPGGEFDERAAGPVIGVGFGLPAAIVAVLTILSLFSSINMSLINIPPITLFGFQIWRIFTSIVATPDFISGFFTLLMLFFISVTEEPRWGSSRLILTMYFRNLAIQLGVTFIGLIVTLMTGLVTFSYGIFPAMIVVITIRCKENPEGDRDCCCGIMIKNKYYPIVLLTIFVLLEYFMGAFALDIILGYALGYWMYENPSVRDAIDPKHSTVLWFESFLKNFDGKLGTFISEDEASRFAAQGGDPMNPMAMFNRFGAQPNNQANTGGAAGYNQQGGGAVYQQQGGRQPQAQRPQGYFQGQGVQIGGNGYPSPQQEMHQLPPGFENAGRVPYNQPARPNEYNRQ